MKRFYITLLLFVLVFTAISLVAETVAIPPSNYGESNAGTENNPFLIANLANLRWLSETPYYWGIGPGFGGSYRRAYFLQTADIDATETKFWNEGRGFSPIGLMSGSIALGFDSDFRGNYNGGHFLISNIYMNNPRPVIQGPIGNLGGGRYFGFFGSAALATIVNVRLHNFSMISTRSFSTLGALIGEARHTNIINSSTTGVIEVPERTDFSTRIGGLVGLASNSTIKNSYSMVNLNESIPYGITPQVGGIAGLLSWSTIKDSFYKGFINSEFGKFSIGGLVGVATQNNIVLNSYIAGTKEFVNVNNFIGIISGTNNINTIKNNFWDEETTGIKSLYKELTGENEIINNHGLSTQEMKQVSTFIESGWDFENTWVIDSDINDGYPYLLSHLMPPIEWGRVTGKVTTTDGIPIEGVVITISEADFDVITDAEGRYAFLLYSLEQRYLTATKDGFDDYISIEIDLITGQTITHDIVMIESVSETDETNVPVKTKLLGNFPNPFNPSTTIRYSLSFGEGRGEGSNVLINIYNIRGQRIKTLVDEYRAQGVHSVVWDGTDASGQSVSSGLYFYRIEAGVMSTTRRMLLIK